MSNSVFSEYSQDYFSDYRNQEFPPSAPPQSHFPIIDIAGNDLTHLFNNIYLDENIDNNKCHICGKGFNHTSKKYIKCGYDLETIVTITTHKKCEKLKRKIDKLKIELNNCEFELFCLKTN